MASDIHVGTSGWYYDDWVGRFYPEDLKRKDWLSFYQSQFDTVELNASFYRLPTEKVFENWGTRAPQGFLFAVKAWRFITHVKKLHDARDEVKLFYKRARNLGDKLGPVLFQTPPSLRLDLKLLEEFLKSIPETPVATIEFRHDSWFNDEVYDLLRKNDVGFCIYDHPRKPCPKVVTSNLVYVRMHGEGRLYSGKYGPKAIAELAEFCKENAKEGREVFVYFNNDVHGYAIENARELLALL